MNRQVIQTAEVDGLEVGRGCGMSNWRCGSAEQRLPINTPHREHKDISHFQTGSLQHYSMSGMDWRSGAASGEDGGQRGRSGGSNSASHKAGGHRGRDQSWGTRGAPSPSKGSRNHTPRSGGARREVAVAAAPGATVEALVTSVRNVRGELSSLSKEVRDACVTSSRTAQQFEAHLPAGFTCARGFHCVRVDFGGGRWCASAGCPGACPAREACAPVSTAAGSCNAGHACRVLRSPLLPHCGGYQVPGVPAVRKR